MNLTHFHRCASQLLQGLGFASPTLSVDEAMISLEVEKRFYLHLGYLDEESCFMLVELGQKHTANSITLLEYALSQNQLNTDRQQPHVALDGAGHLTCWLRLYYHQTDTPLLITSADVLIDQAESLLNYPMS